MFAGSIAFRFQQVLSQPLHGAFGWADEFTCIGLIAIVFILVVNFLRGKDKDEPKGAPDDSGLPDEK